MKIADIQREGFRRLNENTWMRERHDHKISLILLEDIIVGMIDPTDLDSTKPGYDFVLNRRGQLLSFSGHKSDLEVLERELPLISRLTDE